MWAWEQPDGIHRVQIEHILLRGKWRNSVRKCRAYSIADSDYRIVTANLKTSLRLLCIDETIVQRDIQTLNSSTDIQEL